MIKAILVFLVLWFMLIIGVMQLPNINFKHIMAAALIAGVAVGILSLITVLF